MRKNVLDFGRFFLDPPEDEEPAAGAGAATAVSTAPGRGGCECHDV